MHTSSENACHNVYYLAGVTLLKGYNFSNHFAFSLALYIDKRVESLLYYHLPEESQQYERKIGMAPLDSGHEMANFVGSMKKFVYYRSTKYNDMVGGDGKCIV
jgi:hypothetical protein